MQITFISALSLLFLCIREEISDVLFGLSNELVQDFRTINDLTEGSELKMTPGNNI